MTYALVSRFRSSQVLAAHSRANFGIKGTLAGNWGNDIVSAVGTEGGRVESNRMSQVSRLISIVVPLLLGLAVQATAETYPERVVRIINPYPPGGSVDVMARILAQKLTEALGQQVIVENRSGGGGNTGSDFVAKAEPDGYTLLFTAPGPLTVNQTLYSKLPFDLMPVVLPQIAAGKARALANAGAKRPSALPNVPTVAEQGLPGFDASSWYGLVAPAKTPGPVLAKLREEVAKALKAPDVVARIRELGSEPGTAFGDDVRAFLAAETKKWAEVIRASRAQAD